MGLLECPYFNDVWRSQDGATWELVTSAAGWSARPGHQCQVLQDTIVCFGGFGFPIGSPLVPAHPVKAVDTTAAGDAFTAGMAIHYIQHGDIAAAVSYGNAAGALAVTRLGAQPSLPRADQVAQFLGTQCEA